MKFGLSIGIHSSYQGKDTEKRDGKGVSIVQQKGTDICARGNRMDEGKEVKFYRLVRTLYIIGINSKENKVSVPSYVMREILDYIKEHRTKTGHWIFESQYREAWSHTCSKCGKRMTTAYNTYANYCWNCGAKMEGR